MENISLTTWNYIFMMDKNMGQEWQHVVDSVNIHEMAHSFFGDAVVIRHFEHAWLKESWATYVEACWLEDNVGLADYQYDLWEDASRYFEECNKYVRPIVTRTYNSSWNLFDRHLYPGGAWRLHMLRNIVGDENFWNGVNWYLKEYNRKVVETDDFRRALEMSSGFNLTKFFDQWIYGRGYPQLKGQFEYNAERREAKLTLQQTQRDEKRQIGLFDFDVDVELVEENGKIHRTVISMRGGDLPFTVSTSDTSASTVIGGLESKPVGLRIDPENKVLFSLDLNPGFDILVYTLNNAQDIKNRIWAGKELAKVGSVAALRQVHDALKKEPFYGVRVEVAKCVAANKSRLAFQIIADLLQRETDPKAYAPLILGCCFRRDENVRGIVLQFIRDHASTFFRGTWAALQALGEQGREEDLAILKEAANDVTHHYFVRNGALRGLGRTRLPQAFEFLAQRLPYGREVEGARKALIESYAQACSLLYDKNEIKRKNAVQQLVDMLGEEDVEIVMGCVEALCTLQATQAASHIRGIRSKIANQDQSWLDRKLEGLRASEKGVAGGAGAEEVAQLRRQVEALEDKLNLLQQEIKGKDKTNQ
jgi:aminopeptidase N